MVPSCSTSRTAPHGWMPSVRPSKPPPQCSLFGTARCAEPESFLGPKPPNSPAACMNTPCSDSERRALETKRTGDGGRCARLNEERTGDGGRCARLNEERTGDWCRCARSNEERTGDWCRCARSNEERTGDGGRCVRSNEERTGDGRRCARSNEERTGDWGRCARLNEERTADWVRSAPSNEERTGDGGRSPRLKERPLALFLAAEAPYPMIGGGPTRAASVLEFLAAHFRVHGIFFREPGAANPAEAIPAGLLDRADVIDLPFHSKTAFARIQRNALRLLRNRPPLIDRFSGFEADVERCISGRQYEAALIEQFWCAPYLQQIRPRASRVFLDVYNIESLWHQRVARSEHGVLAWSHNRFGRASLELERAWLPRFDGILATSCTDAELMQAIAPAARMIVYPNALPLISPPPRNERHEIVFSGNLEYAPNLSAVQFFHRDVWPSLHARWPELKWVILGKNPGPAIRE